MSVELVANSYGVQTGLSATVGAAVGLTLPTGKLPRHALIAIETNSVRYTTHVGGAPTAAIGILVPAGGYIDWMEPLTDFAAFLQNVKFIGISGTATIQVDFRF